MTCAQVRAIKTGSETQGWLHGARQLPARAAPPAPRQLPASTPQLPARAAPPAPCQLPLLGGAGARAGGAGCLTSAVVAVSGGARVGVGAAAVGVPVPSWREDPRRVHRKATPIAGRRRPHLCPAPGGGWAGGYQERGRGQGWTWPGPGGAASTHRKLCLHFGQWNSATPHILSPGTGSKRLRHFRHRDT